MRFLLFYNWLGDVNGLFVIQYIPLQHLSRKHDKHKDKGNEERRQNYNREPVEGPRRDVVGREGLPMPQRRFHHVNGRHLLVQEPVCDCIRDDAHEAQGD